MIDHRTKNVRAVQLPLVQANVCELTRHEKAFRATRKIRQGTRSLRCASGHRAATRLLIPYQAMRCPATAVQCSEDEQTHA